MSQRETREVPGPTVSIILPTYNRAQFLPEAFASIRAQTFGDWNLIVVDDGSTDDTREVVDRLARPVLQSVRYIYQPNLGASGARNTGLDAAAGRYVAFFDSDDVWLPHHLGDCVAALERNPDVDWAYGACRMVDLGTGRVVAPSTFYPAGRPHPFLKLKHRTAGRFRIIDDPRVLACKLRSGLNCGLQNSVVRRTVFHHQRFPAFRVMEDRLFVARALAAGHRFGYFDNVHVIYNEHKDNTSAAGSDRRLDKLLQVFHEETRGYEYLASTVRLTPIEQRTLRQRLSKLYFWIIGYNLLWQHGRRREALAMFRRGLALNPWDIKYWKVYLWSLIRSRFSAAGESFDGGGTRRVREPGE